MALNLLIATRPWSFPASLVPAAVAAAAVWPRVGRLADAALPAAGVLCLHVFGNLVNTYVDFAKGVDTRASADDRALVDGTVTPRAVALAAGAALVAGLGTVGLYAVALGPGVGALGAAGAGLAFLYTATPAALKYHGLGDVAIFLAFGPLLMAGVAACAVGSLDAAWDPAVLAASVPVGALTVGILHANNARDVRADAAAGGRTLAMALGPRGSLVFFAALVATAVVGGAGALVLAAAGWAGAQPAAVASALAALLTGGGPAADALRGGGVRLAGWAPPTLALPAGTPPEACAAVAAAAGAAALAAVVGPQGVGLVKEFAAGRLATLPQATAQLSALYGVVLTAALSLRAAPAGGKQ